MVSHFSRASCHLSRSPTAKLVGSLHRHLDVVSGAHIDRHLFPGKTEGRWVGQMLSGGLKIRSHKMIVVQCLCLAEAYNSYRISCLYALSCWCSIGKNPSECHQSGPKDVSVMWPSMYKDEVRGISGENTNGQMAWSILHCAWIDICFISYCFCCWYIIFINLLSL